jgi:exodeoxyribonuclease VII large subunit
VYGPRGEYQIILDSLEPRGVGSLTLAFEQLRDKLTAEGLFDATLKKALPPFPRTIGLVTSPKGAAVRDMIQVAQRRCPGVNILLSPTSVQGDKAPEEIVAALDRLCRAGDIDVVIIGRGGGSIEDLWAFNDERVVRAVAACPLPTVSAVGHETDFTLTDFAADVRASTPSAAAELAAPDKRSLAEAVSHLFARLEHCALRRLERNRGQLQELLKRLYDPRRKVEERRQRVDELSARLVNAIRKGLAARREKMLGLSGRLRIEHVLRQFMMERAASRELVSRLVRAWQTLVAAKRSSIESVAGKLQSLSPLAVLARGYSITFRTYSGQVIKDAGSVAVGERVSVRVQKGQLSCAVIGTRG